MALSTVLLQTAVNSDHSYQYSFTVNSLIVNHGLISLTASCQQLPQISVQPYFSQLSTVITAISTALLQSVVNSYQYSLTSVSCQQLSQLSVQPYFSQLSTVITAISTALLQSAVNSYHSYQYSLTSVSCQLLSWEIKKGNNKLIVRFKQSFYIMVTISLFLHYVLVVNMFM